MTAPATAGPATYDFDLHGLVRVRLLDADAGDLAKVRRQLGPLEVPVTGRPDLSVRFVDRATDKPLTFVGVADTGFNDDGFFVLRGKGGVAAKALLPLADIGHQPELVCERGMPAVPHLLPILNLTALAKGVLPLHACAFNVGSTGVLVTGWAKSGKTEALLGCAGEGARYVGDEWVYLTAERQMFGLPEPIRLWAWHLDQLPALLKGRSREDRARLSAWRAMAALVGRVSSAPLPGAGVARRAVPLLERQRYLQIPPEELFGAERLDLRGNLDAVVLVLSHNSPNICAGQALRGEVSGRMLASLADERAAFSAHYRQFRFAFPESSSDVVENAAGVEARLLAALFDGRPAAKVAHPYPCDIAALGRAVLAAALDTTPAPAPPAAGGVW